MTTEQNDDGLNDDGLKWRWDGSQMGFNRKPSRSLRRCP